MFNLRPLNTCKCACKSCTFVDVIRSSTKNSADRSSSSLPSSPDSLNIGLDKLQASDVAIYVYQSESSPLRAVRCDLHAQDLKCMETLLNSVSETLKLHHKSVVKRLISRSGEEVIYPHDIIPDEVYEAVLSNTDATPKRLSTVRSTPENFDLDEHEHNVSQKDYIRIFVFRPYIPIYLKKCDLASYADVLESISYSYGFPIQSVHHLDGIEVRSPHDMVEDHVYIAVENSPKCEYFNKPANNKGSADSFICDGMPCVTQEENVGSDFKPVESSTGTLCPAAEDYKAEPIEGKSTRPLIDIFMHIFVRSLYSYRGNLLPIPCALIEKDLSSMPHLLNILSALMHPPGHYFTRLFDKNRKEVKDPRRIRSRREYFALPHVVSHKGWNYLHGVAPTLGWAWNGLQSPCESVLSLSNASVPTNDPDENSLACINCSTRTSICDLKKHHSIHELQRKPSDQVRSPSRGTVSLPNEYCYSEGGSAEKNLGTVANCSHTAPDIRDMHEIIPSSIISAMREYAALLHSLHTYPDSSPIILNVSSISIRSSDSVGSGRQVGHPFSVTNGADGLSSLQAIKSAGNDADDEGSDDASMELDVTSFVFDNRDFFDEEMAPHPVDSALGSKSEDSCIDEKVLKNVRGNSLSFLAGPTTSLHSIDPSTHHEPCSHDALWTRDEGTKTISKATTRDPGHLEPTGSVICKGLPEGCDDPRYLHSHSQLLTAPLERNDLMHIYVYLDTKSAAVSCYLTEDDLMSIKTVIDAIARHAFVEPGIIIGLNNIHNEPIKTIDEISDGEYYIAEVASPDNAGEHLESLRKPSKGKSERVSFRDEPSTIIPRPGTSSESTTSTYMNAEPQRNHIFVCLQESGPTNEIVFNKQQNFSWPDLLYDITAKVSPDDQIEFLRNTDGKIVSNLDDVVNGCLYVAVPKSASSADLHEEDQKKPQPTDIHVPIVEEKVTKQHVQPSQASPALDEAFNNMLKGLIPSTEPRKAHPTSEETTPPHGVKPTRRARPGGSPSPKDQSTEKPKNILPNTIPHAEIRDTRIPTGVRDWSSPTSSSSNSCILEDNIPSTLAPSLINMASLVVKLLEIVIELMRQELSRMNELDKVSE